jgi:hypothetical protein
MTNISWKNNKQLQCFLRAILEGHLFTIKVNSQFKLEFLYFQAMYVDSTSQPIRPSFQSPILEIGLTASCWYRDEQNFEGWIIK